MRGRRDGGKRGKLSERIERDREWRRGNKRVDKGERYIDRW